MRSPMQPPQRLQHSHAQGSSRVLSHYMQAKPLAKEPPQARAGLQHSQRPEDDYYHPLGPIAGNCGAPNNR